MSRISRAGRLCAAPFHAKTIEKTIDSCFIHVDRLEAEKQKLQGEKQAMSRENKEKKTSLEAVEKELKGLYTVSAPLVFLVLSVMGSTT